MKIGRNDPCPCGSGKKFKKCHLNMPTLATLIRNGNRPPPIPPRVPREFERNRIEEDIRREQFGEIRPIIHLADYHGYQFVVVRNRLYYSKKWKFFTDFLLEYGLTRFGKDWFEEQKSAPIMEHHPAWVWRQKAYAFMGRQPAVQPGVYAAIPNGPLAACINLYYDLYTVDDNGELDDDFLGRLKQRDQFQGARHELFAQATCLRAGFSIIRENERDRSRRHVEFVAVHKSTNQHVLVEAKSRHRPGVMAQPGVRSSSPDLKFRRLINDAITKDPHNPLAIFVDTNLPPDRASRFYPETRSANLVLSRAMTTLMDTLQRDYAGVDPYNLLVFSNHPQHYAEGDKAAPGSQVLCIVSKKPRVEVHRADALRDLVKAANLYGNVPTVFPPNRNG